MNTSSEARPAHSQPTVTVFLMILIAVGMEVVGQILYKSGINRMQGFEGSPFAVIPVLKFAMAALSNWRVLAGIGVYCLQAGVWWAVLSRADLSYAFPLTSMSYVLLLMASRWYLGEHISLTRWLGALAVVFGVYLITRSAPLVR
ncbi:MAG TPA: EamA family transporter [Terriglobales bacterium]|nr:EamA family transporter [Terriglobales bacterium]